MDQKKSAWAGMIPVIVFCSLALVLLWMWQSGRPVPEVGDKSVVVVVTHGDGTTVEFRYQTDLEYLGDLLTEEGLISGTDSEYGLFVDTVDGETADYDKDGAWWRLTCNGEDAATGVSEVVLASGDEYGWIYTR